jgi:DNA adenine methylase
MEVKPLLKWVGGKRELVPEIRLHYQSLKFGKYIEPFFGGGSVFLDIIKTFGVNQIQDSIINDVNSDLIDLYRNIKLNPSGILENCYLLENDFNSFGYYHIRDRFNGITREKNPIEKYNGIVRSAALIVLNRTCFNGLYRTNRSGLFNVPEGRYKNPKIINPENLFELSKVLPDVNNIRNGNFDSIEDLKKGDLVYFDPPYHPLSETSSFTDYSGNFGATQQIQLKDYFKMLDEIGVFVIQSNSSSVFIKNLYEEFQVLEVDCSRNINSNGKQRGKVKEFLIIGNTLSQELERL